MARVAAGVWVGLLLMMIALVARRLVWLVLAALVTIQQAGDGHYLIIHDVILQRRHLTQHTRLRTAIHRARPGACVPQHATAE